MDTINTNLLIDTLAQKVSSLLLERNSLRSQEVLLSAGSLRQDKAFVLAVQNSIFDKAYASDTVYKLLHLLMIK